MRRLEFRVRTLSGWTAIAALLAVWGPVEAAADANRPGRFAILVEAGPSWDSADPQPFFLVDPLGREPLLEFQSGRAVALALDTQLTQVLMLRGQLERGNADIDNTLFGPAALGDDRRVASARYEGARVGIFLHGLLRADLFEPASDHRTMGRFGLSLVRSRLTSVELFEVGRNDFEIESWTSKDALQIALEAEWIGRIGRTPWFVGVGATFGIGQGPRVVFRPAQGSPFVESEFEYQPNRLVARIGYRFGAVRGATGSF